MEAITVRTLSVPFGRSFLHGELAVPADPRGVVVLPREGGHLAAVFLQESSFATATCDFPPAIELRDIELLRARLAAIAYVARREPELDGLPAGILATGMLAPAAIEVAAQRPGEVAALVCRGGRLDLASGLEQVRTPTLLIAASADAITCRLNEIAFQQLHCVKRFDVLGGAPYRPDDPRTLAKAAELARDWFSLYLRP